MLFPLIVLYVMATCIQPLQPPPLWLTKVGGSCLAWITHEEAQTKIKKVKFQDPKKQKK